MREDECKDCVKAFNEVRKLEDKGDKRHLEYLEQLGEYMVERSEQKGLLTAMHKRLDARDMEQDNLKQIVLQHLKEEEMQNLAIASHMATTNELLKHVATKDEVTVEKGRLNLAYKLGGLAFILLTALGSFMIEYIAEDIKNHTSYKTRILNEVN